MGHALNASIGDVMIRWRRMCGDTTSWTPGVDHAGIATQSVVERHLWRTQQLTRHQLGRKKFVDSVHAWRDIYGDRIERQLARTGAALDWDNKFFTLDDSKSDLVRASFVELFRRGLVQRRRRMINWCPHLQTALSDIEVDEYGNHSKRVFTVLLLL